MRLAAAKAASVLITWELAKNIFQEHLELLFSTYINLINELDNETLVNCLEAVICTYNNNLEPFAMQLVEQLSSAFMRMTLKDANEDEGEASFAAGNCLSTLNTLVESLANDTALQLSIMQVVQPVIAYGISWEGSEHIEETFPILSSLMDNLPSIPPGLYMLFP